MMKKIFSITLIASIVLFMFISCTTKPKTGSVKGSVVLKNDTSDPASNPIDFSGATITLYTLAILDTTIARINTEYPHIGVLISQETQFDHRGQAPLASTVSRADGSFILEGVNPGTYNLVIFKDNWGIRYIYNILIEEDTVSNVGSVELFPITTFDSTVLGEITLKSDHTYIIQGNTSFVDCVTIEQRACIFADPGSTIKFFGNIATPETIEQSDSWKLTSSRNLFSLNPTEFEPDDFAGSVQVYGEQVRITSGLIRYIDYVEIIGVNCEIENFLLYQCASGLASNQANLIANNLLIAYLVRDGININSSSSKSLVLSDSILMNANHGVFFSSMGNYAISNCYFYGSYMAIRPEYGSGYIRNNAFASNYYDILFYGVTSTVDVSYNDFFYSRGLSTIPWFEAEISYNNFYRTNKWFISIWNSDLHDNSTVYHNQVATNNYWAVANIDEYLIDANDNEAHPDQACPYYIIYQPKRSNPVPNAGIQ